MKNYEWPPLSETEVAPRWNGQSFEVGERTVPVLAYQTGASGWNEGLTQFHEENAGENHFIDEASRQHALEQLACYLPEPSGTTILEIGCSSGFMLEALRQKFPQALVTGSDYIYDPLPQLAARLPGVPLLQFDLRNCPLPDNSVDAVVLLNVLEHIEDDCGAVEQLYRILKPGGIAVIEVPAGPELYDVYDRLLMHYRRYSLKGLSQLMTGPGFEVVSRSHLGVFFYPGFWLVKQRNKRFLGNEVKVQEQVVAKNIQATRNNPLLVGLMKLELQLGKIISYPFGIRCLITCRKPA